MIIKNRCPHCNHMEYIVKFRGSRTGVFCRECGKLVQWIKDEDIDEVYHQLKSRIVKSSEKATKKVTRNGNVTIIKCGNCDCQLHNSRVPVVGQFNLIDAKFCPQCGRELI